MAIERICLHPRCQPATIAALAAGCLYLLSTGTASDGGRAVPNANAVLVSVSLLDMSRLAPSQFGDWEPAASQQRE